MSRYYIIARNPVQGKDWIARKRRTDENFRYEYPNHNDLVIVTKPDQLRGLIIEHGILLDGWRDFPNIEEILFFAKVASGNTIPALRKAYEEIQLREQAKKNLNAYTGMNISSILIDEVAQALSDTIDQEVMRGLRNARQD